MLARLVFKRAPVWVGLSLLAGVVTSVGVAWWLALRDVSTYTHVHGVRVNTAAPGEPVWMAPLDFADSYRPGYEWCELRNNEGAVASGLTTPIHRVIAVQVSASVSEVRVAERTARADREAREKALAEGRPINFGRLHPARDPVWPVWMPLPDREGLMMWGSRAAGWPRVCVANVYWTELDGRAGLRGGVRVLQRGSFGRASSGAEGVVPMLPVWSGLAMNTAAYGAGWAVVVGVPWIAVRGAVRWGRRRAGRCAGCGYEGGVGGACPECGEVAGR